MCDIDASASSELYPGVMILKVDDEDDDFSARVSTDQASHSVVETLCSGRKLAST